MNLFLEHSDMAHDSKGITQFNLPPTHEPYLSLILSHTAIPPFGWYSIAHAHGGMARLSWPGGWLYTEIDFPAPGVEPRTWSPIPVQTAPGVE